METAVHMILILLRNMGKEAVEKVLRERQSELFYEYYKRLRNLEFDKRVKELGRIRDEEGYIAESKKDLKENTTMDYEMPIIIS